MKDDAARHRFYATKAWLTFRASVLRDEPLCRRCAEADRLVIATHLDHIIPLAKGGEPLDRDNVQPLCHPCHSEKTRIEEQLGRPRQIKGCDKHGQPLDSSHHWNATTAREVGEDQVLPGDDTRPSGRNIRVQGHKLGQSGGIGGLILQAWPLPDRAGMS